MKITDLQTGKAKLIFGDPEQIKLIRQAEKDNDISKSKIYNIDFSIDGFGSIEIEAYSEEKAKEEFENYTIYDLNYDDLEIRIDRINQIFVDKFHKKI